MEAALAVSGLEKSHGGTGAVAISRRSGSVRTPLVGWRGNPECRRREVVE
jgi:hypothetical protein